MSKLIVIVLLLVQLSCLLLFISSVNAQSVYRGYDAPTLDRFLLNYEVNGDIVKLNSALQVLNDLEVSLLEGGMTLSDNYDFIFQEYNTFSNNVAQLTNTVSNLNTLISS